jgi:hypothetical protein
MENSKSTTSVFEDEEEDLKIEQELKKGIFPNISKSSRVSSFHKYNWFLQCLFVQLPLHLTSLIIGIYFVTSCTPISIWLISYSLYNFFVDPIPNLVYYLKKHCSTQWFARIAGTLSQLINIILLVIGGIMVYGNNNNSFCDHSKNIVLIIFCYIVQIIGYIHLFCFPIFMIFICLEDTQCLSAKKQVKIPEFEELA